MNSLAVLFFLLTGGMFLVLFRVPFEKIGASYHRLITYLCLIGWTIAFINTASTLPGGTLQFSLLIVLLLVGIGYVWSTHARRSRLRHGLYWIGVLLVLVLMGTVSMWPPGQTHFDYYSSAPVLFVQFTLTAAILGSILDAMICGHWYLVNSDLSLDPIRSISRTLTWVIVAKIVALTAVLYGLFQSNPPKFEQILWGMGSLFWVRALASLPGGLLLNWMSWKALEVRNTQAATGILYASIVFIIIGEFFGYFLTMTSGVAL